MKKNKLSNRQFDVMNIFWRSQKPLIASEVFKADSELNMNTVRSVIKALLNKGFIEVCDIVHSRNVLAQQYKAVVSKESYLLSLCKELEVKDSDNILVALVAAEKDRYVLDRLEEIIKETKKQLEE